MWLNADAVPGRVTIGITTLLIITTLKNSAVYGLPQVNYVRAIDVWMGTCTAFVFAALLEFILANYVHRNQYTSHQQCEHSKRTQAKTVTNSGIWMGNCALNECFVARRAPTADSFHLTASTIDLSARILFPVTFFIFNVLYWLHYCRDTFREAHAKQLND
jgi:hypothetical protein